MGFDYAQYILTIPPKAMEAVDPIDYLIEHPTNLVLRLKVGWTDLAPNQRVMHQTVRRILKRNDTPNSIKLDAQHFAYADVLRFANTSAEHVAKVEQVAADRKVMKAKAGSYDALIAKFKELL